ncbi:MAG: imidazolonepropionase [Elusimicrobia bacterium]|nr:imidazolonepropionase [Elusimicrobiota bacterium]
MRYLVVNISQLLTMAGPDQPRRGKDMGSVHPILDGAVLVEDGRIAACGFKDLVLNDPRARGSRIIDAGGRVVAPGFVDSHSHPVFAAPRLSDFEARTKGKTYEQLAADGGGILSTVAKTRGATQAALTAGLQARMARFIESGTTTLEAKSGYGLDPDTELKMLRSIATAGSAGPLELVPTLLAAHAVPPEYKDRKDDYLELVCAEIIPKAASEGLARFVDVFCEAGYFTVEDAERVLAAGAKAGLKGKVHADQLTLSGGARLAAKLGAVSADHLERCEDDDIRALAASPTVATFLPGSDYFLAKPYPPARRFIDAGAAVALATDFNPGSCPCWDMRMILSIACTQMGMTPAEAMTAATVNGAHALGLGATHGALQNGKAADLVCWEASDYREIPYYFGGSGLSWVMKAGAMAFSKEGIKL